MFEYLLLVASLASQDYIPISQKIENRTLQISYQLRNEGIVIYDQEKTGTCVGHAVTSAIQYEYHRQYNKWVYPSRSFVYYNGDLVENGYPIIGNGLREIKSALEGVNKYGWCEEKYNKWDQTKIKITPSNDAYLDAEKRKGLDYKSISNVELNIKKALEQGHAVLIGALVYEESIMHPNKEGIIPMPTSYFSGGGHAMLVTGYDNTDNTYIVQNSWGKDYGKSGYVKFPREYFSQYVIQLEIITNVQK